MRLSTEGMAKEIQQLKSENTTLQFENLVMREALEALRKFPFSVYQKEIFDSLFYTNTDQLAKQREADLKLINGLRNTKCSCACEHCEKVFELVRERERIYKGGI